MKSFSNATGATLMTGLTYLGMCYYSVTCFSLMAEEADKLLYEDLLTMVVAILMALLSFF